MPNEASRSCVVGLVGALGAGKSTVAKFLEELGAEIIVADQVVHKLLEDPGVRERLSQALHSRLPEDPDRLRPYLAGRIFSSQQDRKAVESVLHPLVEEHIQERLRQTRAEVVVLDVPLLKESGMDRYCQLVVFVEAPEGLRRARIQKARGWSPEHIEAREKAQLPVEKKREGCDFIIDNSGSLEDTRRQVKELWERLLKRTPSEEWNHGEE